MTLQPAWLCTDEEPALLRREHLDQVVAPQDDMWTAFADAAASFVLDAGGEPQGIARVDDEGRLLLFHVRAAVRRRASELLAELIARAGVRRMMVATSDPGYLGAALDLAEHVESHTLLYARAVEPEVPELEPLRAAERGEAERIVAFEERELGAPRTFLEAYVGERLERGELLVHESVGEFVAVGELRRDRRQAGVAQLGVVVRGTERGRGLGARMMAALACRAGAEGLVPVCSTERANVGARRAIERAGFRADHRILVVVPRDADDPGAPGRGIPS